MQDIITIDLLEENLDFFYKMYDQVRLVDPVTKKVIKWKDSSLNETEEFCYTILEKGKICDNCISAHAYKCNKSFIKLEHNPHSVMLITAIPIEGTEGPLVLELIKDATESMIIDNENNNNTNLINATVSQLNDLVSKDSLTGLYNRRYIDDRLPADIIKATIHNTPLSIIFMDLNNFKLINDKYGHAAGDIFIKDIGTIINNHTRNDTDWSARYGGDEFIICLNNTNNETAYKVINRIQESIEKHMVKIDEEISLPISASMGAYTMYKTKLTAVELINKADEKMYEAKKLYKEKLK